ncbi:MAG: hypothetical protein EAX89_17520, partial [Candidatus Lokiarchaeota archaeon]|nr:hypothetical protein [Candidatus Lokiarchaeota archaeon]
MKLYYKNCILIALILSLTFITINSGFYTKNIFVNNESDTGFTPLVERPMSSYAPNWQLNGIPICIEDSDQNQLQICEDGKGGTIIVWIDQRSGTNGEDIYAQRIDSKGNILWTPNGTVICDFSGDQRAPQLCSDGMGGAIITWLDLRPGSTDQDIYAQRINSTGSIQWDPDGVVISNALEYQSYPQIISDGVNGAIITWKDGRNSMGFYGDIY